MLYIKIKHGEGQYIYENGTKFIGKFENDSQKFEKKEDNESLQKQIDQQFIIYVDDLINDESSFDMKSINKIILRHWTSLQNIFTNLCQLNKLWIIIELYKIKNIQKNSMYDINQSCLFHQIIHDHPNQDCNITDKNHCFLFRQFHEILLRLSS